MNKQDKPVKDKKYVYKLIHYTELSGGQTQYLNQPQLQQQYVNPQFRNQTMPLQRQPIIQGKPIGQLQGQQMKQFPNQQGMFFQAQQQGMPFQAQQQVMPLKGQQQVMPLKGQQQVIPLQGQPQVNMLQSKQVIPLQGQQVAPLQGQQVMPLQGHQMMPLHGQQVMPLQGQQIVIQTKEITKEMAHQYLKEKGTSAVVDIDQIKNVGGTIRVSHKDFTPEQRKNYRSWLRKAYTLAKVAVGAVALVASFGAAGDSASDLIFLIIDTAFLVANISTLLVYNYEEQTAYKYIKEIYYLEWTGTPQAVQVKMKYIFKLIEQEPSFNNVYTMVCQRYLTVLDSFAAMVGSLISTMVPEDAGAMRIIIETIILEGLRYLGKSPFDALAWIFNSLPEALRNTMKDEKSMKEFIITLVSLFKGVLPTKDDTYWQAFVKNVKRKFAVDASMLGALLIPGVGPLLLPAIPIIDTTNILLSSHITAEMASKLLDGYTLPMAEGYARTMMRVLPITFSIVLVFDECKYKVK